jgi:uncharacterized protein with von Willebrand factor type A (vWA) domain
MGGTNIRDPLKAAYALDCPKEYEKQIFLLTDGQTEESEKCIKELEQIKG